MHASVHAMRQRDIKKRRYIPAALTRARVCAVRALIRTRVRRRALADLILRFVTPLIPHLAFTAIHQGADVGGITDLDLEIEKNSRHSLRVAFLREMFTNYVIRELYCNHHTTRSLDTGLTELL